MTAEFAAKLKKARRLVETGAVHKCEDVQVFMVEGDHDVYLVTVLPETNASTCSCPSRSRECSHVLAVLKTLQPATEQPADPFEGVTL